ncbi:hypothetical protein E4U56_001881 [Claviceps arundinis]|uniref:Uncharacterized protein n=1 Tax=Claviceps arundinis TaxID=1623583 RepID=A0A9P7MRU8_9HYPO|nr:hypothetical protein E4U56_001881 [Claviceps arundinis]
MSSFLPSRASNPSLTSAQSVQNRRQKPLKQGNSDGDLPRASSLGSWFKQMLPSNRPERGGTLRPSAFQVQKDLEHASDSNKLRPPATHTRWRKSVDVIEADQSTNWDPPRTVSGRANARQLTDVDAVMRDDRRLSQVSSANMERGSKRNDLKMRSRPAIHGLSDSQLNVLGASISDSPSTSTPDFQSLQAKQEARRFRRNLKESGDYLGVQGFNPETSKLDVVTPTDSERSSLSQETQQKLLVLKNALKDARHNYKSARERSEQEAKYILLKKEKERDRRLGKKKDRAQEITQTVTWKRHARQWSSAQEPNLSPIAQSILDTSQASGTQSRGGGMPVNTTKSNSSLIDFDYSAKQSEINHIPQQGDRGLTQSPDSVATVLRTPHRRSLATFAEMGPSAWELFKNGISFDTSEDTNHLQDDKRTKVDAQEPSKKAQRMVKIALADKKTTPEHTVAQATVQSFLGIGSKIIDPGGKKVQESALLKKTTRTERKDMLQEDTQGKCGKNSMPLRHQSLHYGIAVNYGTMNLLKRKRLPSAINKQGTRIRDYLPPQSAECRRKIVPNLARWGHWVGKGTIRFTQNAKTNSPRILNQKTSLRQEKKQSALDLELNTNLPNSGGNHVGPSLAQHVAPSRPMLTLGVDTTHLREDQEPRPHREAHSMGPEALDTQDKMAHIQRRNQTESTRDMALRNRAQKVTKYASTHITTTTGCEPPRSKRSFQDKPDHECSSRLAQPRDSQVGRAMYKLPQVATSDSSLGSSVMRILQKPSPKAKLAKDCDEIGITLRCNPRHVDWHMKKKMKPYLDTHRGAVSRDVPATPEPGTQDVGVVDLTSKLRGDDILVGQAESRLEETDDVSKSAEDTVRAIPLVDRGVCIDMLVEDELTVLVQAPGRFPCGVVGGSVDAADDADAVVQALDSSNSAPLMESAREFLGLVWCYVLPLWQMYWERIGPLIDFESEYWARQGRDEGTVGDCLTVVLAIPISLFLMAIYVVALRLGLVCIESFQDTMTKG